MSIELHNEDCLQTLSRMKSGSVDLMLQDTPFGVTQNEWDIAPEFEAMWPEWLRVGKENCAYIFFGTQPFVTDLINSNRKMFKYDLIWYKANGTGFLNSKKMPLRNHEHILLFYRKPPIYNPEMRVGRMRSKGGRQDKSSSNFGKVNPSILVNNIYHPQSVIDISNGDNTKENDHPTQKPLLMFRYLIKTFSNENDLVFDGYFGSGTTAIACEAEGRNFIGSELNKDYFEAASKRLKDFQMQGELF